jgi:F-type H+-transporting ATPase subunit b
MLIDWFTVGAEAINFLILMWLLKRFLYKPILDAIESREQKIAAELADAATKKAEAQNEREEFQHKNEEFDQQRADLMSRATEEVQAERQRLLGEARKAADTLRSKRQEALTQEYQSLHDLIINRTRDEVFAIARKTLSDLAAASLEERISDVFTRRVREMSNEAKEGFANALKGSPTPVQVRSAFELPSQQRDSIQQAINETLSADVPISYEIAPSVISGIEMTANGRKISWSITDYLATLEASIADLLKTQSTVLAKPNTKVESPPHPVEKPADVVEAK